MVSSSQIRFGKNLNEVKISDVEKLIKYKIDESQNLEYKQPTENVEKDCNYLSKTISGFLNTDGGIIVYGVYEKEINHHSFPSGIKFCMTLKERLENFLISKVQPWEERILIHRIVNIENIREGIFVFDIQKSKNPPHMSNHIYYQRLNYQTQPMNHESVLRVFQTVWIQKRELLQDVIKPLYSEISETCEKIIRYRQGGNSKYQTIILHNRYLYDQIENSLRNKTGVFYEKLKNLNYQLIFIFQIATRIINEQLCNVFVNEKTWIERGINQGSLKLQVIVQDLGGSTQNKDIWMSNEILLYQTLKKYLEETYPYEKVISFNTLFRFEGREIEIPDVTLRKLWNDCSLQCEGNKTIISINKQIAELLTEGREILKSL